MRIWTRIPAIFLVLCTKLCFTFSIEYPELAFVKSVTQNENAKLAIEKLSKTARVLSAVTLLSGLADGSIPVDSVISELMNLGSIDLKSLESFEKSKVHSFMDRLQTANLKDDSKDIEKGLRDLYIIQQKWKTVGNLNALPDDNAYKKLYALKDIDVTSLKNLPFDKILDLLAKPTLSEADVGSLKTSLTDISTKISSTKTSINLEEMIKILESLKPLYVISEASSLIDPITPMGMDYVGDAPVQSAVVNFKLLNGITSQADSSVFGIVERIISSRFAFHPTNREFSAGLINGFADLNKLDDDAKDDWILKLFGSSVTLDELKNLAQLQKPMMDIDDKWEKHATPDVYNSITRVDSLRNILLDIGGEITREDLDTLLVNLDKCTIFPKVPGATKSLNDVAKGSAELSRKVPAYLAMHKANEQLKKEVIIKISTAVTSEDIQKTKSVVMKLQSNSKVVQDGKSFKEIDMQISNTDVITKFLSGTATKSYKDAFDCLVKLGDGFKKVATPARALVEVRGIKTDSKVFDDVKSSSTVASESASSFKSIRDMFGSIKKESKSTDAAKQLVQYSKSFGEGVNALVSADVVLRKTAEFQSMISKGRSIEAAVESSNIIVIEEKFWRDWGDFGKTAHQISTLISRINEWQNEIKEPADDRLEGLAPVFSKVPELNDVVLQAENKLTAVYSSNLVLVPNINTLRDDFIKDLTPISKLDLQFSRFKSAVASMPETMKHVSGVLNGGNSTSVETSAKDDRLSAWMIALIICAGVAIIVSIVGAVLFCFNCCGMRNRCCKKYKKLDIESGGNGGDGGKSGGKDDQNSKNSNTKDKTKTTPSGSKTKTTPSASKTKNTDANARTGGHQVAGQNRADQPEVPPRVDRQRENPPGPSGGAGAPGGVVQVQPGGAPPPNDILNGPITRSNIDQKLELLQGLDLHEARKTLGQLEARDRAREGSRSTMSNSSAATTTQGTSASNSTGQPPADSPAPIPQPTQPENMTPSQCQDRNADKTTDNVTYSFKYDLKGPK